MRKLATLTAAAALVAFGFGGAAQAFDILTIGTQDGSNAEFGVSSAAGSTADPGPYNYDADVNDFGNTTTGTGFPDTQAGPDLAAQADIQQDDFNPLNVNFTLECVLLPGTTGNLLVDLFELVADTALNNQNFDFGVTYNGGTLLTTSFVVATNGGVTAGAAGSGTTELNTFAVNETDLLVGSNTIEVDITDGVWMRYDSIILSGDCVTDFAKVSGVIGRGSGFRGKGQGKKAPTHAFEGLVGELDDGSSTPTGSITINYRNGVLGETTPVECVFEPNGGTISFAGLVATLTTWAYTCTDEDANTVGTGTADLTLEDRSVGGPRGTIAVDNATDSELDFSETDLQKGNVVITEI